MQKGVGVALIASGILLLILKLSNVPEARESWEAWASPQSGMPWFVGILAVEAVLLASRIALGYFVYLGKAIRPWAFFLMAFLTAANGLSGLALAVAALALQYWPARAHEAET